MADPPSQALVFPQWLREYERPWFRYDLIAGASVAALVVPKALGYAGIVGVPIEYGLYAAAAGALIYALFGSSRQISTGPSSALAAVAGGAAVLLGLTDSAALPLVSWVTLLAGLLFVLLAVLRMGWMSQFLSKAVVKGFLFGAALEVTVGELPKLTGTTAEGTNTWREFGSWIRSLGDTDLTTLVVGVLSLGVILGLRFWARRVPGALVLVVLGILATRLLGLEIALVGDVPSGLPSVVLPDIAYLTANLSVILPAAIGVVLIGFSQSAGDAREFASKHGYRVDINRESVAQGLANIGSGMVQGIPVATSLSASSLNDQSGAKTQMSSLVTGLFVVLTMLFLAPLFSDLPKAVLAAVIIDAVVFGMIDLPAHPSSVSGATIRLLDRHGRHRRCADLWSVGGSGHRNSALAGLARLRLDSSQYRRAGESARHPGIRRSGQLSGGHHLPGSVGRSLRWRPLLRQCGRSARPAREILLDREPPIRTVIIDCGSVNFIDSQGAEKLRELHEIAAQQGVALHLSNLKADVREVLATDGLLELYGTGRVHAKTYLAVQAHLDDEAPAEAAEPDA